MRLLYERHITGSILKSVFVVRSRNYCSLIASRHRDWKPHTCSPEWNWKASEIYEVDGTLLVHVTDPVSKDVGALPLLCLRLRCTHMEVRTASKGVVWSRKSTFFFPTEEPKNEADPNRT